jgi:hypothetical protein
MLSSGTCVQTNGRHHARVSAYFAGNYVSAMRGERRVAVVHSHVEDTIELRHAIGVNPEFGSGIFSVGHGAPIRGDLIPGIECALFAASLPSGVIPARCLAPRVVGLVLALKAIPKLGFRLRMRDHGISML